MTSGKGYATDVHEIVRKEVSLHMKPFIDVTMLEHEATRSEVRDLRNLVCATNKGPSTHDMIQYGLIGLIVLGMLTLTTCA